jgi:hypothetical protein
MSSTQIVLIVVAVAVVAVVAAAGFFLLRRRALQQRFGDEYSRLVQEHQSRSAAEKELRDRERRHAELQLRDLAPEARERYAAEWQELQARFVDAPEDSVGAADKMVTRLIGEIGYPTGDYDDQVAHLSVDHARTLSSYRRAHEIGERAQRHEASVEELRQAVVQYRELVAELLGESPVPPARTNPQVDTTATDSEVRDSAAPGETAPPTPVAESPQETDTPRRTSRQ